jgi:hypothetical protein
MCIGDVWEYDWLEKKKTSKDDDEDQEKDENLKKCCRPILDQSSKRKKQIEVDTSYSEGSAEYDTDDSDDMSKNWSSKNKYNEDSDFEIDDEDDDNNKEVEEQNDLLNYDVNQHQANSDGLDWNNGAFSKKQIDVDTSNLEGAAEYDTDDNDDMSKKRSSKKKYNEDSDFEIDDEDDDDNKEVKEQNGVLNNDVNQHRANSDGLDWNNGAFNKHELWDKKLYNMDFYEWQGKMNWRSSANCMDHTQRRLLVPCIATLAEMFAQYSQHPGKEDWPQQEWVLLQLTDIDCYGQKNPKKHRSKTANRNRKRKRKEVEIAHGSADTPLGIDNVEIDREITTEPKWYEGPETTGVEDRRPKKRNIEYQWMLDGGSVVPVEGTILR